MSLSKIESLPNEILIDMIEKYINGIDVLMAFNYQLNGRFNSLISQCQRFRFNFIQCHKTEFCFCMGLLPAYIDKIEELAISDENTPGQVFAFLNFFPSFVPFKRLRTLYLHFDGETVDPKIVRAILSLNGTTINTISMKLINANQIRAIDAVIGFTFHLKTLKRFSLSTDSYFIDWDHLFSTPLTIEHMTISGLPCGLDHLPYICQCAPNLKYLNIQISTNSNHGIDKVKKAADKNMKSTCQLRTLILSFQQNTGPTMDTLAEYLRTTPRLNRLEIKTYEKLVDVDAWESLLESSLPKLTHFNLQLSASSLRGVDIQNVLASFQKSFWLTRKNFNIIITAHQQLNVGRFEWIPKQQSELYEFDQPVITCWMTPNRSINNALMTVDKITCLKILELPNIKPGHYYFDNVKCLAIDNMNRTILEWITTYVNCSKIKELMITSSSKKNPTLTSLFACLTNLSSLHISWDQFISNKDAFMGRHNNLKSLDISCSQHDFNEKFMVFIGKFLPHVEHLQINTLKLDQIPMLKTYLPHLRSLNFKVAENTFYISDEYRRKRWEYELRQKTNFLFTHKNTWITIWMDHNAFEDPYWQTFSPQTTADTNSTNSQTIRSTDDRNKKKNIFSFLKFFK